MTREEEQKEIQDYIILNNIKSPKELKESEKLYYSRYRNHKLNLYFPGYSPRQPKPTEKEVFQKFINDNEIQSPSDFVKRFGSWYTYLTQSGYAKDMKYPKRGKSYFYEDIDIDTSVEVQEKLKNGEIVFMAGDRLSAKNVETFYEEKILDKDVKLPIGVLKFAQMLDSEIYFVTCAKNIVEYEILAKRFEKENSKTDTIQKLQKEYASFLQSSILKYPYQFYHFSKFFE